MSTQTARAAAYCELESDIFDVKHALFVARFLHDEAFTRDVEWKEENHLFAVNKDLSEAATWALYQADALCRDLVKKYLDGFAK